MTMQAASTQRGNNGKPKQKAPLIPKRLLLKSGEKRAHVEVLPGNEDEEEAPAPKGRTPSEYSEEEQRLMAEAAAAGKQIDIVPRPDPEREAARLALSRPAVDKPPQKFGLELLFDHVAGDDPYNFYCPLRATSFCKVVHSTFVRANSGNNNLKVHLKTHHAEVLEQYKKLRPEGNVQKLLQLRAEYTAATKTTTKQTTLAGFERVLQKDPSTSNPTLHLVVWALRHDIAFDAFEGPEWHQLCQVLKFTAPCATTLRTKYIPSLYELVLDDLKGKLAAVPAFSATSDSWTQGDKHMLSLTAHLLDDQLVCKTLVLGCEQVDTSLTSPVVAQAITDMANKSTNEDTMFFSVTTDGGANFKAAGKLVAENNAVICVAHTSQLVGQKALEGEARPGVSWDSLITKVANIVDFFAWPGGAAHHHLVSLQQAKDGSHRVLLRRCPTRWFSTFDMIQRFLDLWPLIEEIHKDQTSTFAQNFDRSDLPSPADIKTLSSCISVLGPLRVFNARLQNREFLFADVAPCMVNLFVAMRGDSALEKEGRAADARQVRLPFCPSVSRSGRVGSVS